MCRPRTRTHLWIRFSSYTIPDHHPYYKNHRFNHSRIIPILYQYNNLNQDIPLTTAPVHTHRG
nr:MAG TPA: hypothetical protein [Caudoviricetes sp.]